MPVDFIARLEGLETVPDTPARIIINDATGTIVRTARVSRFPVVGCHGNITINIASTLDVSNPSGLARLADVVGRHHHRSD